MAGISKPSVVGLKPEITWTVNALSGYGGSGGTVANAGLFNGIALSEYAGANSMAWYNTSSYIDITINDTCNIWRCGTTPWAVLTASLKIEKWDGSSWVNVTSTYPQTITQITELQWEKTISQLPQGRYKFSGTGDRLDSEWYLESLFYTKYLIKNSNNNLFKINSGVLTDLGVITPTESIFTTQGMNIIPSLTESMLAQIGNCKVLKWTDDGVASQTLNMQGEYKDKIVKLIPNWKLKMWTDDIAIASAKLNYTTNPYRPIDKLGNDFKVLMYKE